MKRLIIAACAAALIPMSACTKDFDNSTVDEFDLTRYLGVWYEIARYDHSFERGMDNTMALYILQDDGKVIVERQFRYPLDCVITEIPAGKLDSKSED